MTQLIQQELDRLNRYTEAREEILRGEWFLVRIAGNGMGLICRRCGSKHTYLTLMCVEQPFCGVTGGLYAFWTKVGEAIRNPAQEKIYKQLTKMFGSIKEDFSKVDSSVKTNPHDMDMGGLALGILEPISKIEATKRVNRINATGLKPALIVEGINDVIPLFRT